MDSAHRQVELQAPSDLTYLEQNAKRAATAKIDLNFPPAAAPEGEDALRRRVEELVDEYLKKTFVEARKNISINGMPVQASEEVVGEEFEPFNHDLLDKIRALEAKKDAMIERVAALRRNAPEAAAQNFQSAYTSHAEAANTQFETAKDAATERGAQEGALATVAPKREEEVKETYKKAVSNLDALNKGLGGTVGKLERAVSSMAYLEGK